jgi:SAM-dependent methyltransferase
MTSSPTPTPHDAALDVQRAYYADRRPTTMRASDSPYARRHLGEVLASAALEPGASVCEWGSGLGRFTRLLLAEDLRVHAIELTPELAAESREALGANDRLTVSCGDVAEVLEASEAGAHDAMLGFFVLHHRSGLPRYFRAAHRALRPGGRLVFAEPNPWHPLYPVQIGLTPGMSWSAERGIYRLTPGALRRVAAEAGFAHVRIRRYGALPRAPYDWLARVGAERVPEILVPRPLRPFQVLEAWR